MNAFFLTGRLARTLLSALAASFALVGSLAFAPATALAQQAVAVVVNGQAMTFDQPPIVQAGRVFVPLRSIFQQLGASVVYADGQINATGSGRTVSLTIGSTQATVNGEAVTLDVAPFVVGDRTLVPLRFVAQSLGASVNWDDGTSTVTINNGAPRRAAPVAVNDNVVTVAPPPLPEYQQPYVPAPNYIWTPGYWAWGSGGYYWVPGTWAQPPQTGLYWTPGYWAANTNNGYVWNAGYWAPQVGFYGGINYGFGYYGQGYQGGQWGQNGFAYNTAASNVNTTIIHNTYINRTVIDKTVINRTSYNGGRGGVQRRPLATETVPVTRRVTMTPEQLRNQQTAAQDRSLYYSNNGGKPATPVVQKPVVAPKPVAPKPVAPKPATPKPATPKPTPPVRPAPTERPAPPRPVATERPAPPRPVATERPQSRPATMAPEARPTQRPVTRATARPETRPATARPDRPVPAAPETKATRKPEERPTAKATQPPQ